MDLGTGPSRVGCVTDSSTDLTGVGHQMNGGSSSYGLDELPKPVSYTHLTLPTN